MKHILVIADFDDSQQLAFNKALRLAKLTVADIHVVTFRFEPLCDAQSEYYHAETHVDLKKLVLENAQQSWDEFIASQTLSVKVTHEIVWEKYINQWILKHCADKQYDLIVKSGHRSENIFYTPTDWQLFRESIVPVYCVVNTDRSKNKVVLVALDLMTQQKEKQQLNERLLEAAFQLSVQTNSQLHCCVAIKIPTLVKDMDLIDVTARIHQLESEIRQRSKEYLELYGLDKKQLHIREGKPWHVVNNFAQKLRAECIVIGSMGRKGIPGKLIGNTAEKVIHSATTDLLVI